MENTYYRPEWTCGRYNKENQVALMYNLIEGMSYLFEDDSAEVISEILRQEKNGEISIDEVSSCTSIGKDSLVSFFEDLIHLGLLTTIIPAKEGIDLYRRKIGLERRENLHFQQTANEDLSIELSDAEKDYFNRVGGVTNVMFELTYNCSEKCIHCYNPGAIRNDSEKNKRGNRIELELNDYYRIIDELYELGLVKVCLTGGDPFSKPTVWKIIEYLYKKGIAIEIFTNGQGILESVERLAMYYPLVVGISIYSGIAEEHDQITRIKGSWTRSMKVIEQLAYFGIPLNLKCCIMRLNVRNYHLVAEIAKKYGAIPQFSVQLINSLDGDICVSNNLRLPTDVLELVLRDNKIPFYVGKERINYGAKILTKSPACESFCITPEGSVQPCCAYPSPFGNLKNTSFTHILQHSKELKWWRTIKLSNYNVCGKNNYCCYCRPCPGINFAETGSPLKPAKTNCDLAIARYNLAEKLKQGRDPLNGKSVDKCLSSIVLSVTNLRREFGDNYLGKKLDIEG